MSKNNGVAEVGGVMLSMMDLTVISHHLDKMDGQLPMATQAVLIMFQGRFSH
jgi:hypothetical protein